MWDRSLPYWKWKQWFNTFFWTLNWLLWHRGRILNLSRIWCCGPVIQFWFNLIRDKLNIISKWIKLYLSNLVACYRWSLVDCSGSSENAERPRWIFFTFKPWVLDNYNNDQGLKSDVKMWLRISFFECITLLSNRYLHNATLKIVLLGISVTLQWISNYKYINYLPLLWDPWIFLPSTFLFTFHIPDCKFSGWWFNRWVTVKSETETRIKIEKWWPSYNVPRLF